MVPLRPKGGVGRTNKVKADREKQAQDMAKVQSQTIAKEKPHLRASFQKQGLEAPLVEDYSATASRKLLLLEIYYSRGF